MTKDLDPLHGVTLCKARRRNGQPCGNRPITGATVCRMHGGSAPQVRAAAQVRLLMEADTLMAALLKIAKDEKIPVQHRLVAIRDGLDRANLAGKQEIEIGVVAAKTFEDYVGDAVVDLEDDYGDEPNVVDAEVVEDEPVRNRHDARAFREVDRAAPKRKPAANDAARRERERKEAEALNSNASRNRLNADREALLLEKEAGRNMSSRGEALRKAAAERGSRARISDADMS